MTFNEGDEVYLATSTFREDDVEKWTVTRVTPTLAIVHTGTHRGEQKFDRKTGEQRPKPSAYAPRSRIVHRTPEWDARYARSKRRYLARALAYAATHYDRGDEAQAARMESLFAEWRALGAEAAKC